MDEYLTKPIDRDALELCIERCLGTSGLAVESLRVSPRRPIVDEPSGPVDLVALKVLTEGDDDFERDLVASFSNTCNTGLRDIGQALKAGDAKSVARVAHALKGAGASMHASAVSVAAANLEAAAREGEPQPLEDLAQSLRSEVERAVDYLQRKSA
jgi:HPt (histidine-containing phosphotransfer) domain-containing protein